MLHSHLIHKLAFHVRSPDQQQGEQMEKVLREEQREAILQAISEVLDRECPDNKTIRLDQLALDLGKVSKDEIIPQLREVLPQKLQSAFKEESSKMEPGSGDERGTISESESETSTTSITGKRQADLLLFYLAHGKLPWWASGDEALPEMASALEGFTTKEIFTNQLWPILRNNRYAIERLVLQYDSDALNRLLLLLAPGLTEAHLRPLQELIDKPRDLVEKQAKSKVYRTILTRLMEAGEAASSQELTAIVTDTIHSLKEKGIPDKITDSEEREIPGEASEEPVKDPEAGIYYINNAGLILLHPFFATCFGELDYLDEDKQFKDEHYIARAVHLMHYMGKGEEEHLDHQWPLNKILCGLEPQVPVEPVALTEQEKQEAEELLEAVIQQWDKLKNTSIAALRQTFLQREGKLEPRDEGYHLHLEPGPFDMLLDYLPWQVSVVKLPWMGEMVTMVK